MKVSNSLTLVFAILGMLGSTRLSAQPVAAKSKMMHVVGAGVTMNTEEGGEVSLHVAFMTKLKKIPRAGAILIVTFENPADSSAGIEVVEKLKRGQAEVLVDSVRVTGFECRLYKITAKIYADETRKELLDELTQEYQSIFADRLTRGKSVPEIGELLTGPYEARRGNGAVHEPIK